MMLCDWSGSVYYDSVSEENNITDQLSTLLNSVPSNNDSGGAFIMNIASIVKNIILESFRTWIFWLLLYLIIE